MSKLKHYYGLNHLHYLTTSTYRRARLFDSERFRSQWGATLGELRRELGFKIVGYVLIELHAQQSGEARLGEAAGRLAVVELEVLFSE